MSILMVILQVLLPWVLLGYSGPVVGQFDMDCDWGQSWHVYLRSPTTNTVTVEWTGEVRTGEPLGFAYEMEFDRPKQKDVYSEWTRPDERAVSFAWESEEPMSWVWGECY